MSVVLVHAREDDQSGGHADAHRQRLCRKEDLDESALEEDLDHLLDDREETAVVNTDTAT